MKNIAIFASGGGTNAEAIISHFKENFLLGKVVTLISNNASSYALKRAENHGIESKVFTSKTMREDTQSVINYLKEKDVDLIVLAGYMVLMPSEITEIYDGKIVNIHPALLPKFGGKGMYGNNVHKAVIEAGEKISGITIHYVNAKYDEGAIIFQAKVEVEETDTAEILAEKIHTLEHIHYPKVIATILSK